MNPIGPDPAEELHRRVDEVLHYIWDPIGICDEPGARDEYVSYLPTVIRLVESNAGLDNLAAYLDQVVTECIGLNSNLEHSKKVAEILIDWKTNLDSRRA